MTELILRTEETTTAAIVTHLHTLINILQEINEPIDTVRGFAYMGHGFYVGIQEVVK